MSSGIGCFARVVVVKESGGNLPGLEPDYPQSADRGHRQEPILTPLSSLEPLEVLDKLVESIQSYPSGG